MREELAAKTREIEIMTAALAIQAQGQGREHDEAEDVDCAPAKADHAADIDRIYSAVFGGSEAVGGGDVEISAVLVALKGSNQASFDDGEAGKSSVASRADEICEKTLELRDQLKSQQDEATALHEEVARLRESLAKAESDAVDAKGQARRLQEQIQQLRAAEADVETAAPAGMCHCLG
jgi:DNA repair exonuclease SbcCD ATPase subunit